MKRRQKTIKQIRKYYNCLEMTNDIKHSINPLAFFIYYGEYFLYSVKKDIEFIIPDKSNSFRKVIWYGRRADEKFWYTKIQIND